jgi:hypothetical protein
VKLSAHVIGACGATKAALDRYTVALAREVSEAFTLGDPEVTA